MSTRPDASKWLLSHHSGVEEKLLRKKAKTISVISGKGGVGKTSTSIKLAKLLAGSDNRVLLIDCDSNLSNTSVKLGLPIQDNFYDLLTAKKSFKEAIYKDGNFHLLSACNGNIDLFESAVKWERIVIDLISGHEEDYDYIVLDCPAGLGREVLTLSAYTDDRIVVVTPDRSSITDSYSMIKVLNQKYGISKNHLLLNKISNRNQYKRLVKSLSETVETYLNCRLTFLGAIQYFGGSVDQFDRELAKIADSKIHEQFFKAMKCYADESSGTSISSPFLGHFSNVPNRGLEQDVQPNY